MAEAVTEQQAADTLTKGPAPFSLTGTPRPDTLEAISAWHDTELKKIIGDLGAKTAVSDAAAADAEADYGKTVKDVVKPAMARAKEQYEKPGPKLPTMLPTPHTPDISARPFGANQKEALGQVVSTLGLMAQMAMGAGKAPKAALGAFTGAMTGWAEGDSIRAEREWKSYLGQVDTIRQENRQALLLWEAASRQHGQNEQAATAALSVSLAEAGFAKDAIAVAEKGRTRALQDFKMQQDQIDGIWGKSLELEKIRVQSEANREMQAHRLRVEEETRRRDEEVARRDRANEERDRRNYEQRERHFNTRQGAGTAGVGGTAFSEDDLEDLGARWRRGEDVSQLVRGRGGDSTRTFVEIQKRGMRQAREAGQGPEEMNLNRRALQSNTTALRQITKEEAQFKTYAVSFEKALGQALTLSDKLERSGFPKWNKVQLEFAANYQGNEDAKNLISQMEILARDVDRVLSRARGVGAMETRQEARKILDPAMTSDQFHSLAKNVLSPDALYGAMGFDVAKKDLETAIRGTAPKSEGGQFSTITLPDGTKVNVTVR